MSMTEQVQAAETVKPIDEKKLYSVIGVSCAPQIESLAELVSNERDRIVEDKLSNTIAAAKAAAAKKEEEKELMARDNLASLKTSFTRKSSTHLIASRIFHNKHQYFIFIPLQVIVAAIAIIAFVASYQEGEGNVAAATVLTVIAGVLGIVAGSTRRFINALDRYLDWRTQSAMHKGNSATYARLKEDIMMVSLKRENVAETINRYDQQLKTLEQSNGDLQVPLELITVFDDVENMIHKRVEAYNDMVRKCVVVFADRRHLIIDYVKQQAILMTAYGFLASRILTHKSTNCFCIHCCCPCLAQEFPYALPEHRMLTKIVKKLVEEEIAEITDAKFSEPSEDEYKKAQKLSQSIDGSRAPKVPDQGGASPSADNNV
ncbi:unnamed protein product [Pelagomonas calceolata]|uniref:Uncharacterized protein n=1 Tax=Pelagomonas calceolata TaxID=35677 RepID=A0A8J2SNC8_9STRA|nr:unnamed protein product [Pelagomonas calceolata]